MSQYARVHQNEIALSSCTGKLEAYLIDELQKHLIEHWGRGVKQWHKLLVYDSVKVFDELKLRAATRS